MYNWTAIYLINCENLPSQVDPVKAMFDQIFSCPVSDNAAVVFCMKMPVAAIQRVDPAFVPGAGAGPADLTTVFYRLEALPAAAAAGGPHSKLVKLAPEDREFKMTDKDDVASYFKMIIDQGLVAEKQVLLTWGHGSGSGIFFTGFPDAGSEVEILRMEGLKEAIQETFGTEGTSRIDVMIMMNCYMQYFDSMYALRTAGVDYLMASQFGLDFVGYNYKAITDALFADTVIQPKDLAILAVTSLKDAVGLADLEHGAFFASDLSVCDLLAAALCKLGDKLGAALPGNEDKIMESVPEDKYIHSGYDLVDLFVFTEIIRDKSGGALTEADTQDILDLRGSLIIKEYIGELQNKPDFTLGCNICLPVMGDNNYFRTFVDPASEHASLFSKLASCGWPSFLHEYAELLPEGAMVTRIL
ncbi:MAG TPA: clostripain-related cysteine peptidase [Puia sp.]|nr:clostripain-related cysteine peptidase [Puia sp.]